MQLIRGIINIAAGLLLIIFAAGLASCHPPP